jgi:GDP-mannose 6-dehydrogenase
VSSTGRNNRVNPPVDTKEQRLSIAVFGLGYVGCVTAACFAELGFKVVGVDVDPRKVRAIQDGRSPFYEPGLEPLIQSNLQNGRLSATTSTADALAQAGVAFLCVGTPSSSNGNLSLDQLRRVAADIEEQLPGRTLPLTLVVRSTVFPGTCDEVIAPVAARNPAVSVVANPEFLREGTAVKDFMEPSLLVLGSHDTPAAERIAALYAALPVSPAVVSLRTAELIKYACNAFHALKIAFANEIGTLAMGLGLAGEEVMETICRDTKLNISATYLKPGFAFGGSCLPKDLRALNYRARQLDVDLPLLNSVLPSNEAHISRAFHRVMETGCRKLGIYGLAFKPNTDDLRESPGIALIERLIGKGYEVKIYDPHIQLDAIYGSNQAFLLSALPHIGRCMEKSLEAVLDWADVLVVTQEPVPAAKANIERHSVPVLNVANANLAALAKVEAV